MQRLPSWQLFTVCVLVWSTTWYAITWQIDATTPEAGVAWRFSLAAAVLLAGCAWRGEPLALSARQHTRLALQGVLMYSLGYIAVYHAERHIPSGLVAVGYSAAPLLSGLGARLLLDTPLTPRFVAGGFAGVAGVALIFLPQFEQAAAAERATLLGAGFTALAVLLSTAGNLAAVQPRGPAAPFWPALGFGMAWGAALSWAIVLVGGDAALPPPTLRWWSALLYLALFGSVLAFACYITLLHRVGPARSATIGVMTPLLALGVSIALEGYRADAWTAAGVALAALGNVLMLRGPRTHAA